LKPGFHFIGQGLKPGAFKAVGQLNSTCTAPPRAPLFLCTRTPPWDAPRPLGSSRTSDARRCLRARSRTRRHRRGFPTLVRATATSPSQTTTCRRCRSNSSKVTPPSPPRQMSTSATSTETSRPPAASLSSVLFSSPPAVATALSPAAAAAAAAAAVAAVAETTRDRDHPRVVFALVTSRRVFRTPTAARCSGTSCKLC
jgi:hypothetical protein